MTKERIAIWGTARRAAMYSEWLATHYEVIAYVSTTTISGQVRGIPVVEPEQLVELQPDKLVICVENNDVDAVRDAIGHISPEFLCMSVTIDEVVSEFSDYLSYVNQRQLAVIDEILNASDAEIADYDWMYERVVRYGLFCFYEDNWPTEECFWTVYGLQQIPEEFASFCNYISGLTVETAAEVGVYRGRSAFFLCAVLARKNPKLRYRMIDIYDRIDDFELFREVLPQLEKCIPSSSDDNKDEKFDFVFIDADHSYDASIKDFENVGLNAKTLVVFHDIYAHEYDRENGGTVRTWKEVIERTAGKKHREFSKFPDRWMGIGCVEMSGE